jgi:putative ABC transport system permease protein
MGLSVLGVAIGVAVVVSIDVANTSAERAFQLSAETVTGTATHQVVGAAGTLDDAIYRQLRTEAGVRPSAPVVEGYASLQRGDRTFQVVGIDPFTDAAFRPYLGTGPTGGQNFDLGTFMTQDAALLSAPTAEELGLSAGDTLRVDVEGTTRNVLLAGLIEPEDDRTRRALSNLLVVDVSTAQTLFDMRGELSRIDLLVPSDERATTLDRIRATLPAGARLQQSETRTETIEQMTRAFELNLTALSLLALVVGAFLIYNTMTFSMRRLHGGDPVLVGPREEVRARAPHLVEPRQRVGDHGEGPLPGYGHLHHVVNCRHLHGGKILSHSCSGSSQRY